MDVVQVGPLFIELLLSMSGTDVWRSRSKHLDLFQSNNRLSTLRFGADRVTLKGNLKRVLLNPESAVRVAERK